PGTLQELISQTMVHWAQESFIQSPELVRAMFSLLHRQYDGLGELERALPKAYTISAHSVADTTALLECLGQIRSLLIVQMGPEEENLMIQSIGCAPLYPPRGHPAPPEGVPHPPVGVPRPVGAPCPLRRPLSSSSIPHYPPAPALVSPLRTPCAPAGVPHPLCGHPSSRGCPASPCAVSTCPRVPPVVPLGRPPPAPRPLSSAKRPVSPRPGTPRSRGRPGVVTYLASCGLQSCPMLLSKGYPDIGWNPCGGERYLDFLRFAVFVNGEQV
ncbi:RYR1 protein, partial [Alectura lathami]|nr:RYR1 protein [Alectura lathami]